VGLCDPANADGLSVAVDNCPVSHRGNKQEQRERSRDEVIGRERELCELGLCRVDTWIDTQQVTGGRDRQMIAVVDVR